MANICYERGGRFHCETCPHYKLDVSEGDYACFLNADNKRLVAEATARIPFLTYNDLVYKTIVEISTRLDEMNREERVAHFMAYGYDSDLLRCGEEDHRFLEYTFFIVPLEDALDWGDISDYEAEHSDDYKQYIEDCTAAIMVDRYLCYDNGKTPLPIRKEELDINVPDGMYILM
jgi:hypothetical protein